jgi:hypothetical protein
VPEVSIALIGILDVAQPRRRVSSCGAWSWAKEQALLAGVANLAGLGAQLATGPVARPFAALLTRLTAARYTVARGVADGIAVLDDRLGTLRDDLASMDTVTS